METNRAKNKKCVKNLIKKLQKTEVAFLYEVTIKYFTACRDSLQVAAICALQSHYTSWRSKQQTNQLLLCARRAGHEYNNASLSDFFTLLKPLEVGIRFCSVAKPEVSRTCTHLSKIFRARARALHNFAASACALLLSHQAWSQNF